MFDPTHLSLVQTGWYVDGTEMKEERLKQRAFDLKWPSFDLTSHTNQGCGEYSSGESDKLMNDLKKIYTLAYFRPKVVTKTDFL